MKTVKFSGTIENAYGKKLDTALAYNAEYEEYSGIDEVRANNDLLKDEEVVKVRNVERKANARQKAMQAALDQAGIAKPTLETEPQLRLRKMFDIFVANGSSIEEARALASSSLGIEWED